MNEHPRRSFIRTAAVAGITTLAGCLPDYGNHRRLALRGMEVDSRGTGIVLRVNVANHNTFEDSSGDFHDVTVLGYDSGGELVCRREIGVVSHEQNTNNGEWIEVDCSASPTIVTAEAAESPCEEDVKIEIARYSEENDNWIVDSYRECDEGLPPQLASD